MSGIALNLPWDSQPQEVGELSHEVGDGYVVIPSLGPVELVNRATLTATGTAPANIAEALGRGWYMPQSASENGYRFGVSPTEVGTGIYVLRADAAPSASTFGGLGAEYLQISWDHTNAAFRGVVARREPSGGTWATASLGTLVAGGMYVVAVLYDGADLYAIKDGVVVSQVAATGTLTTSTARWGSNQVAGQGYTPGITVFGAYTSNKAKQLAWVLEATMSPAAFWNAVFAPRQIWIPASAASALPTLSFPTAINITASSFQPRVSYAF